MSKAKVVISSAGVKELLCSEPVEEMIKEKVDRVLGQVDNSMFTGDVQVHHRVVGVVKSANPHGYYDCLKNNTLLKALGGAK